MADFPRDARQTKGFVVFVLDVSRGALSTSGGIRTLGCFFPGRADFTSDAVVAECFTQTWATLGQAFDRGNFLPEALCARSIQI